MFKFTYISVLILLLAPAAAFPDNIADLIEQLKSNNNLIRIDASDRLMKSGPSSENLLLDLLDNQDDKTKMSVIWVLGEWGKKKYVKHLLPFLDQSYDLSRRTIVALGKIGDAQTVPALVTKLQAKSRYIRTDTVYALGKIGEKSALSDVLKLRDDPDWHVREAVAVALGSLANPESKPLLESMAFNDPELLVRMAADDSLKALKNEH